MTEQDPAGGQYVAAPAPIAVLVTIGGVVHTGRVIGWRGDRVYVGYRTDEGNHLAWVPAGAVERITGHDSPGARQ